MPRCADCHWLENAPPSGRQPKPCGELSELPQNLACDSFTEIRRRHEPAVVFEPKPMEPKQVEAALGALLHQNYRHIFGEVLAESFALEQDGELALKNIQQQLQSQGANIVLDAGEYKRTLAKLVDLYVTYRLTLATGLAPFAEQIMGKEIERRFRHVPDPPPQRKRPR